MFGYNWPKTDVAVTIIVVTILNIWPGISSISTVSCLKRNHTGKAAIENVNTIDERDQTYLETVFSIVSGDKWQSKTLFLAIFDPSLSIVKSVFDCRLSGVGILW